MTRVSFFLIGLLRRLDARRLDDEHSQCDRCRLAGVDAQGLARGKFDGSVFCRAAAPGEEVYFG
ncbi:hypothetical protein HK28_02240 [Acetobacter sp. DsW_063]|nr:hypothetical protein HK28_02240 [Acetobacter sp. DsW_063]